MNAHLFNNLSRFFFLVLCVLGVTFSFVPQTSSAQVPFAGGVTLKLEPQFPGAHTPVTVSLDDYSINTAGAQILWYVDSVAQSAYTNARAMQFTTGTLGKKHVVNVRINRTNALPLSASVTIIPTEIHIILEADTYVPSFYRGRALPSVASPVRAIVLVQDGTKTAPSEYTYTWTEEGTVLLGGPIKGKNSFEFNMPQFGSKSLSVSVLNPVGEQVGKGYVLLEATEPELRFYEESPLRGLLQREMVGPFPFIGDEMVIHGEPYFMSNPVSESTAQFTWKIGGNKSSSNTGTPNALRLERIGARGDTLVQLDIVTNDRAIPQFLTKRVQLVF